MTKQELLESTIKYYGKNPEERRCYKNGRCYYSPKTIDKPSSEGCAIGRYLDSELAEQLDKGAIGSVENVVIKFRNQLPQWMLDLSENSSIFLRRIQRLHDSTSYWNGDGGKRNVSNWQKCCSRNYHTA